MEKSSKLIINKEKKENPVTVKTPDPSETEKAYPWHKIAPKTGVTLEDDVIEIEGPTPQGKPQKFDWISVVFQPLGALLAVVILLVILHVTGSNMSMGLFMLIGGITGILGIIWSVVRFRKQKKETIENTELDERQYLEYLLKREDYIRGCAEEQLKAMEAESPSVYKCSRYTESSPELWSNTFRSASFLQVRVGSGDIRFTREIRVPEKRYSDDSSLLDDARALQKKYEYIHNAPVCCNLRQHPSFGIVGTRRQVITQTQDLIITLTALHSYEDVKLMVAYPENESELWAELRFLPHVFDDQHERRFLADNKKDAATLFSYVVEVRKNRESENNGSYFSSSTFAYPQIVLIIADMSYLSGSSLLNQLAVNNPSLGISVVYLAETVELLPSSCQLIAEIKDEEEAKLYQSEARNEAIQYVPDALQSISWGRYLKRLSPIRLENPTAGVDIPQRVTYFENREIGTEEEMLRSWKDSHPEKTMSVLLGMMRDNTPFFFDIHPSRSGAHGIFVGTNGSGKSSIVRSWILSMASKFSPQTVSFVLVDFKGTGLIYGLERLPHIAGTISNLDKDIQRNLTALQSEIIFRQKIIDDAKVLDYYGYLRQHYAGNPKAIQAVPFLFIVIDELNEFKMWSSNSNSSETGMQLLDRLYQTGRGLGIHVIAGSQTTEPFTPVMEKNARFRWCLKTATEDDSKFLLKTDDAFRITVKGRAIVRVGDNEIYEEIQPVFSDAPFFSEQERKEAPEQEMALLTLSGERRRITKESQILRSELNIIVDEIVSIAEKYRIPHTRRIWPDRLPQTVLLSTLQTAHCEENMAIVGLVDDPVQQAQYPLQINIKDDKSILIYGSGRTGKTQFLQTLLFSLLQNTPSEKLNVYIVESAAGEFDMFRDYPHVQEITDSDSGGDLVKFVEGILSDRLKKRTVKQDKRIVLLVDNLNAIMPDNKQSIKSIVQKGAGKGIHFIASALNDGDSVSTIQNNVGRGFCFWFSPHAFDYKGPIKNNTVQSVPPIDIPGRGIGQMDGVVSFQTALIASEGTEKTVREYALKKWGEKKREPIKEMIPNNEEIGNAVRLGKSMSSFYAITQDFNKSASLLIVGDNFEQREALQLSIARQLSRIIEYQDFVGIDTDGDGWNEFPNLKHIRSGEEFDQYLEKMSEELRNRKNLPDKTYLPYIIFVSSIKDCLDRASEVSRNRIDKNALLNASRFSIYFIAGCSFDEYAQLYEADEQAILKAGSSGKEVVPFRRLCASRNLIIECKPEEIHYSLKERYMIPESGSYYLGAGKAERIKL